MWAIGAMFLVTLPLMAITNFIQRDRDSELRSRDCWAVVAAVAIYIGYVYLWLP